MRPPHRLTRFVRALAASAVLLLVVASSSRADAKLSTDEERITVWTVAVMPFAGRAGEGKELTGPRLSIYFANAMRPEGRFNVIEMSRVAKALEEAEVKPGQIPDERQLAHIAKSLHTHGTITGKLSPGTQSPLELKLTLHSRDGVVLGEHVAPLPEDPEPTDLVKAGHALADTLPYDALVVRVAGKQFLVNAGTERGIKEDQILSAFTYASIKSGKDGVKTGKKLGRAQLLVLRASERSCWVQPIRGAIPEYMTKVSFEEIPISREDTGAGGATSVVGNMSLSLAVGAGLHSRRYSNDSAEAAIRSTTTLFPEPNASVYFVPYRFLGFDTELRGSYGHAFIPFRQRDPDTGDETELSGSLDQWNVTVGVGRTFGKRRWADTHVALWAGYGRSSFDVEDHDPLILTRDTYSGLDVGLAVRVPVVEVLMQTRHRIFLETSGRYAVTSSLKQAPVDDGDAAVSALGADVGIVVEIFEMLDARVMWQLDTRSVDFSGTGSRGFTDSSLSTRYQGVSLQLVWAIIP